MKWINRKNAWAEREEGRVRERVREEGKNVGNVWLERGCVIGRACEWRSVWLDGNTWVKEQLRRSKGRVKKRRVVKKSTRNWITQLYIKSSLYLIKKNKKFFLLGEKRKVLCLRLLRLLPSVFRPRFLPSVFRPRFLPSVFRPRFLSAFAQGSCRPSFAICPCLCL